jgi:hypothetical protein
MFVAIWLRRILVRNVMPAMPAMTAVLLLVCGFLVQVDRSEPVDLVGGYVIPESINLSQPLPVGVLPSVTIRWEARWQRRCEGIVSRELVGADGVIRFYVKEALRIPAHLGQQVEYVGVKVDRSLPPGKTKYREVLLFYRCGLTSRIWPLEIEVPELEFQVVNDKTTKSPALPR